MAPEVDPKCMKNRGCVADAFLERPGAPKVSSSDACVEAFGVPWLILGAILSRKSSPFDDLCCASRDVILKCFGVGLEPKLPVLERRKMLSGNSLGGPRLW